MSFSYDSLYAISHWYFELGRTLVRSAEPTSFSWWLFSDFCGGQWQVRVFGVATFRWALLFNFKSAPTGWRSVRPLADYVLVFLENLPQTWGLEARKPRTVLKNRKTGGKNFLGGKFDAFLAKTSISISNCETQAIMPRRCNSKNTNCCAVTVATKKWKQKCPPESEDAVDLD